MAIKNTKKTNVTRITASADTLSKEAIEKNVVKNDPTPRVQKNKSVKGVLKPFLLVGGYFKGAWFELKQVHWPTRKATWSLTGAVIAFTGFFVVVILLLDAGFKYLFELILG